MTNLMFFLLLFTIIQSGFVERVIAEEPPTLPTNPVDYIPLKLGNQWTYIHSYENHTYSTYEGRTITGDMEMVLKPFEVPGYPLGVRNVVPDDSLLVNLGNLLTIEITHTEIIDGLTYFVFNNSDYNWPPLPTFFWGGKSPDIKRWQFNFFYQK